jgi:hypothetical protein
MRFMYVVETSSRQRLVRTCLNTGEAAAILTATYRRTTFHLNIAYINGVATSVVYKMMVAKSFSSTMFTLLQTTRSLLRMRLPSSIQGRISQAQDQHDE